MGEDRKIETAVSKLAGNFKADTVKLISGTIKSVDEDKATCVVTIENGVELPNVLLQASVCDGLLIIPKVGSTVYVLNSTYNDPFVTQFSDIEKYYLQVGDSSFTVFHQAQNGGDRIVLNDGSYKGIVKVDDLVTKLNALEDDLNNLKTALKTLLTTTVNEPGNGAPSAFQIALNTGLSTYYGKQFTDTTADDLQNKTVTHGK